MAKLFSFVRALFLPFLLVFHTGTCSILVTVFLLLPFPKSFVHWFIHSYWSHGLLILAGVKVVLEGEENVPAKDGFLYLFTHSSHFDIPVLFTHSPRDFRFGGKAELFSIPRFGKALELTGTLPIARGDRSQVIEVYKKAEERVKNGEAFALAPEGGRRKGSEISSFKSGPFIFAANCKMPLVPVVIYGVDKVLTKGSYLINYGQWHTQVKVRFLPAIPTEGLSIEQVKALKDKVREDVVANYKQMQES